MAVEFIPSDPEVLRWRITTSVQSATGPDGSPLFPDADVPGTPGYNLVGLLTSVLRTQGLRINQVLSAMSPRTAEGAALDAWAGFFALERQERTASEGEAEITASVTGQTLQNLYGSRTIPAGTRLLYGAGELEVVEDRDIPLNESRVTVPVRATISGSLVVEVGTALTVSGVSFEDVLSARVSKQVSGGRLRETDTQLRSRLVRALIDPGTADGFEAALLNHPLVSRAVVSQATYGAGTLEAFVVPAEAFPPSTLRAELEALYQGPGRAFVLFPPSEGVLLRVRSAVESQAVTDAVVAYVNNLEPGSTLIISALEAAALSAGAGDFQVLSIRRGLVDEFGEIVEAIPITQVTNLLPRSGKHKFVTRSEWIKYCS
ncbi:MAG: hypothetical protein D6800_03165 [Candidatus Zixiibacteriota bacterium]|nr:MAG: hypothetical protein D6800_03165 [candidate division Zixibacteria bacterium]